MDQVRYAETMSPRTILRLVQISVSRHKVRYSSIDCNSGYCMHLPRASDTWSSEQNKKTRNSLLTQCDDCINPNKFFTNIITFAIAKASIISCHFLVRKKH